MTGITSYGAYIPLYRINRAEIAKAWESAALPGEKAIASYDEDSVTMAVAAALDCLGESDRNQINGLFLATTTPPYKEKQAATIVATAVDLGRETRTVDFTDSLKTGTSALNAALDAVKSGSAKNVMVVASDCRLGATGSEFEQLFGDGAAAITLGDAGVVATIEGGYSLSNEIFDLWRADTDTFVRSWESRFTISQGYHRTVREAVSGLLSKCNLTPGDFAKVVIYGPDARSHAALIRSLGFDPRSQVQDPLHATIGNSGAASALMMLVAALEEAKPGDRILLANYGDGADAFVLRVTEEIERFKPKLGIKGHLASKRMLSNYGRYMRWRKLIQMEELDISDAKGLSPVMVWRQQRMIFRLYGHKCKRCGTPHLPPQRVCPTCQAKDEFEDYRFSDKRAKIFTFTVDNLTVTYEPPVIRVIVDFDGGGRTITQLAEATPDKVKIGAVVEPTFRSVFKAGGVCSYHWKVRLPRQEV